MSRIDEELFEAMMKKASEKLANKISDEYPSPEELQGKYTYSPEFELWVKTQIKRNNFHFRNHQFTRLLKGAYGVSKQVAAACCVILVVFTLTAFSVPPIRIALMNFIIQQNSNHISVDVKPTGITDENDTQPSDSSHGIPYVPDGFTASDVVENDISLMITYTNKNNESIWLEKHVGSVGQTLDDENAKYDITEISGQKVYSSNKSGINTILFFDGESDYKITSSSSVSMQELLKMAQHILLKK